LPALSIVIVNWNTGEQLRDCLTSLATASLPKGWSIAHVVVVDNASSDNSADGLACRVGTLQVLRNPVNLGFGAACNQGARVASGDALLFLNPDTRLYAGSLEAPLRTFDDPAHEGTGIVGIALEDERGEVARVCARFPRARHYLAQALGIDRLRPATGHLMREWDHLRDREVDQVIGAFFLVRRGLFDRLGGFDERFFVYFEEVDFALRARQVGSHSLYLASARAFHAGGGASRQIKGRRLFYALRSRLQYGAKHFGIAERALLAVVTFAIEPLSRLLHLLLSGRIAELRDVLQGYGLLLRHGVPVPRADPRPQA
jgi:N-acetylglucosaminyl-diphospho-decaprenol L-rhamnosyltransferase